MLTTLSLLRQHRGWHVYAVPAVLLLAVLALVDSTWPGIADSQERIELLERNQVAAQQLVDQRPGLDAQIQKNSAILAQWRDGSFTADAVADSRSQLVQWVQMRLAPLNLVNLNIVDATLESGLDATLPEPASTAAPAVLAPAAPPVTPAQAAPASDAVPPKVAESPHVRVLSLSLTFDASPAQMAQVEQLLTEADKRVAFQAISATSVGNGPPGTGRLSVSYRLQALHLPPSLF